MFRTDDFSLVATIPVGKLPHGVWPSGDGSRIYVGLENEDALAAIDTATNKVVATIPIGQAPQAVNYVPNAVPEGEGAERLQPLGVAGRATHLVLAAIGGSRPHGGKAPTSVSLFDQGLAQVVQASATADRRSPMSWHSQRSRRRRHAGALSAFTTNPAGSAIVNAVGPIKQIVGRGSRPRRYLVIVSGTPRSVLRYRSR